MKEFYKCPETYWCAFTGDYFIATSPTGEDFTDPEEYGGI